jgi:hypothetical protein
MGQDKEKKKLADKLRYERNKEKIKEQHKEYYENNKEQIKQQQKIYVENNKEEKIEYHKEYYLNNKEKITETAKNYYSNNREHIRKINNIYVTNKLLTNPLYKLKNNIQTLIRYSITKAGFKKLSRTEQILGCTYEELKQHLESKFEDWMTWENRGLYNGELNYGWDIDHIIPTSSATTEIELLQLHHYTNLQPLCGYYNRHIKRAKL